MSVVVFASSLGMCAQNSWAVAVMEDGCEKPYIMEYHGIAETVGNGKEYCRIVDDSYRYRNETFNPVTLRYGYRWEGKKLFVYDFDAQQERLAMDVSLSVGDVFTTCNGMEWIVETAKDTLVNISLCGKEEIRRLLHVRTSDGKISDQWLEGFGSFRNLFMIDSMEGVTYSQALWMEYGYGEYLTREINDDPFFAHDSGWLAGHYGMTSNDCYTRCLWNNGNLTFEESRWWYAHRDYTCFYRNGNDIYNLYAWEMAPHIDNSVYVVTKDVVAFRGLPTPDGEGYVVHLGDKSYPTSVINTCADAVSQSSCYDIQGQSLLVQPAKGLFISKGKKVYVK